MTTSDIDSLFRKFTISEIKSIERQLKNDAEKKKEDLRQMVGRRYQDIIEAADSISDMKVLSSKISHSFLAIQDDMTKLERLQARFSTHNLYSSSNIYNEFTPELFMQLLHDLPGLIWDCIDERKFLHAAYLFNFSDYSIRIWKNKCIENDMIKDIAEIQNLIKPLALEIIEACIDNFKKVPLTEGDVIDCSIALMILKSQTIGDVLHCFLDMRQEALMSIFELSDSSSRLQICKVVENVLNTLLIVFEMFFNKTDDSNSFSSVINSLAQGFFRSEVFNVYLRRQNRNLFTIVQNLLNDFKCHFQKNVPENEIISSMCQNWFRKCTLLTTSKLDSLLIYFSSIDSLLTLKQSVIALAIKENNSQNWQQCCNVLLLEKSSVSVWDCLLSKSVDSRLKELINNQYCEIFDSLKQSVQKILLDKSCSETFLFIPENDTFLHDKHGTNVKPKDLSILLKSIGVPVILCKLINELNDRISSLNSKIDEFTANEDGNFVTSDTVQSLHAFMAKKLHEDVINFLEQCSIRSTVTAPQSKIHSLRHPVVAKLCVCFVKLSPAIENVFQKETDNSNHLHKKFIDQLSSRAIENYDLCFNESLSSIAGQHLSTDINHFDQNYWFHVLRMWQTVHSEDELEDGRKISSSITFPISINSNLMSFLVDVVRYLCSVGPHCIPAQCLNRLKQNLLIKIAAFYDHLSKNLMQQPLSIESSDNAKSLQQKFLLQCLFDLKFVEILMDGKSRGVSQNHGEDIRRVMTRIESAIDPFELESTLPCLTQSVLKFVRKNQMLLNVLCTPEMTANIQRQLLASKDAKVEQADYVDPAQLIIFGKASSTLRIQTLPVYEENQAVTSTQKSTYSVGGSSDNRLSNFAEETKIPSIASISSFYGKVSSTLFGN